MQKLSAVKFSDVQEIAGSNPISSLIILLYLKTRYTNLHSKINIPLEKNKKPSEGNKLARIHDT